MTKDINAPSPAGAPSSAAPGEASAPSSAAGAPSPLPPGAASPTRPLTPAAERALAEAAARRAALAAQEAELARVREVQGRAGKDPVRYGDWEVKGLASDF